MTLGFHIKQSIKGSLMSTDIKNAGLRVTLPRKQILAVFESSDKRHLSAEDVHHHLKQDDTDVSLATIYRVLKQYEESGLLVRRNFEGDRALYELAGETQHDHIVCVICNRVDEFSDYIIETQQHQIAEKLGYTITDKSLTIYGACKRCNKKNKT